MCEVAYDRTIDPRWWLSRAMRVPTLRVRMAPTEKRETQAMSHLSVKGMVETIQATENGRRSSEECTRTEPSLAVTTRITDNVGVVLLPVYITTVTGSCLSIDSLHSPLLSTEFSTYATVTQPARVRGYDIGHTIIADHHNCCASVAQRVKEVLRRICVNAKAAAKRIACCEDYVPTDRMHVAAVDELVGECPTADLRAIDAAGVYSPPPVSQPDRGGVRWE